MPGGVAGERPMKAVPYADACARHGALRASATSLAVVASLVTWR